MILMILIEIAFLQTQFVADEVSAIVKETIEKTIGGQTYTNTKVEVWTSGVVEGCIAGLTSLHKPFKYIGKLKFQYHLHHTILHLFELSVWLLNQLILISSQLIAPSCKRQEPDSILQVAAFGIILRTAAVRSDGKTSLSTALSPSLAFKSNDSANNLPIPLD